LPRLESSFRTAALHFLRNSALLFQAYAAAILFPYLFQEVGECVLGRRYLAQHSYE